MDLNEFDNVIYDSNSLYSWEELNEAEFLVRVFSELKEVLNDSFNDFFFVVFSDYGGGRAPNTVDLKVSKRKILIVVSDEYGADPSRLSGSYFAIFKAYIGQSKLKGNIFPFPLGYVKGVPLFKVEPIARRKVSVFFRGNLNTNRIDFYRSLFRLFGLLPAQRFLRHKYYRKLLLWLRSDFSSEIPDSILVFNDGFKRGFSPETYGCVLADSKIVLSPKGFNSTECFRIYEAMRAGCVIISEKLPDVIFYKGSPVIQVDDWGEGVKRAKELMQDKEELQRLQLETVAWWNLKCSEKATAIYMSTSLMKLDRGVELV
jgi:hypothetical protein